MPQPPAPPAPRADSLPAAFDLADTAARARGYVRRGGLLRDNAASKAGL